MEETRPNTVVTLDWIVRAKSLQRELGMSNRDVGGVLGIGASTWSQVASGTYPGDVEQVARRVQRWVQDRQDAIAAGRRPFVETRISRQIWAICERVRRRRQMGLVLTPAGAGKTMSLMAYKLCVGNGAIYLRAGQAYRTAPMLIRELRRQLALPAAGRRDTFSSGFAAVREHLGGQYAGGEGRSVVLLVDEATPLEPGAFNLLRDLHDDEAVRLPIVLADTWRLDGALRSPRGIAGGYEQLRSRCGAQYRLNRPVGGGEMISGDDVAAVAAAVLAANNITRQIPDSGMRSLVEIAQGEGTLRAVRNRVEAVIDTAGTRRPTFSAAQIDAAAPCVGESCRQEHRIDPFDADDDVARRAG